MNARGDFWKIFDLVIAIHEFMYCNVKMSYKEINCDSKEQVDILSKLQSMSPEELSKLKDKVTKEMINLNGDENEN